MMLSIITDTTLGSEVRDPVYLRRSKHSKTAISPRGLLNDVGKSPIAKTSNWEIVRCVNHKNNTNVIKNVETTPKKSESPKSINRWYARLKIDILKSLRTKIYPDIIIG